jgi:hypothetical protein
MKIVFLPEFDDVPAPASGPPAEAVPEPDRVAGPAYVVEVPAVPPTTADRFSDTEWSALMGLS